MSQSILLATARNEVLLCMECRPPLWIIMMSHVIIEYIWTSNAADAAKSLYAIYFICKFWYMWWICLTLILVLLLLHIIVLCLFMTFSIMTLLYVNSVIFVCIANNIYRFHMSFYFQKSQHSTYYKFTTVFFLIIIFDSFFSFLFHFSNQSTLFNDNLIFFKFMVAISFLIMKWIYFSEIWFLIVNHYTVILVYK